MTDLTFVEYVFNDTVTLGIVMECPLQSHLSITSPPGNGAVTVSVEKKPKRIRGYMDSVTTEEFVKVKEWIKLNYDVLMSNWNEPDSGALCRNVKKV